MATKAKKIETTKELEAKLGALGTLQKQNEEKMAKWRTEIDRIQRLLGDAETSDRHFGHQIAEITNRLFVRQVLTRKFLAVRNELLLKMRCLQSDQITVVALKKLEKEVRLDLMALQGLCTHPLVFSYDGQKSYSSFEDSQSGHRVCTVCNFRETSAGAPEDIYEVLDENNTRLVRRDLRKKEERPRSSLEQQWFSSDFLQQLFEASAGDINIRWPKAPDPNVLWA